MSTALDLTSTVGYTIEPQNLTLVKTAYGDILATYAALMPTDEIRPEIVEVTAGIQGTATNNKITLKFTETISDATFTNLSDDLVIRDKDGDGIAVTTGYTIGTGNTANDEYVVITFLPASGVVDGTQDITVALANDRYLTDLIGNKAKIFTTKTVSLVADAVAPTIVSVAVTNATTLTVTLSEAVAAGTAVIGTFGGSTVPSAVTAYVPGSTTIVVTVGNTTPLNTLTVGVALTDVVGNPLAAIYAFTCP